MATKTASLAETQEVALPLSSKDEEPVLPPRPSTVQAGGDERASHQSSYTRTIESLKAQPQVKVKIPAGGEYVQINGWRWFIPEGRVMVPEQVAEILEEAGRI